MQPSASWAGHESEPWTPTETPVDQRPARSPAAHFATMESLSGYWRFYWAVAGAQLSQWLPHRPSRLLDLSSPEFRGAPRAAAAGHNVVTLLPSADMAPRRSLPLVNGHAPAPRQESTGEVRSVVGDTTFLSALADDTFDGVVSDNRVLSQHLATEASLSEIARVLRPGGRTLLCVDSVVLGMALLAEQDYWPQLSHAPDADVLLVPWPDGSITRCFTAEQLTELLTGAGLEPEWVKPRTVLSASTVDTLLADDPRALGDLVEMELKATESDDYVGVHLLASARKPARP
ncbi:methyltransferase family protein [Haloactinospora alba]|uniref:Methyltransferase family protein n=1 Tax=Haloactinospora alba TaxID=405555 RepID=A0A543NFA5_9ACTN|nr:methyltransferase domain-containing protein [Haloactinospora alba]TQN30514.1 methyltransferase family protein [Haloactinospora alba]